ncbi:MAG TPA: S-methyl-5'-thioadenosine phosphorylase [Dehalococcoidia bacterium]|nr:S-methyl-5'-thioadenosine phosphorylase [Dehalococcoidia bacterium]
MPEAKIGIIGGSGLYQMEGLEDVEEVRLGTPFGDPSDALTLGTLDGVRVAFLPRHGRGHRFLPSELPSRANIYALKSVGVERIISVSAVGSLKEQFQPLHLVVPDQIIDRTRSRVNTFFGDGLVVHVGFADPFCPDLSQHLYNYARHSGAVVHNGGTMVVMEGPLFSTRAESHLYQSWGGSIIGMTAVPEAKLAREAEICYATLACVTDYDCWHEGSEEVTIEMVISNLQQNVEVSKDILRRLVEQIPAERHCLCSTALQNAIVTDPALVPKETKEKLSLLIGKYVR